MALELASVKTQLIEEHITDSNLTYNDFFLDILAISDEHLYLVAMISHKETNDQFKSEFTFNEITNHYELGEFINFNSFL